MSPEQTGPAGHVRQASCRPDLPAPACDDRKTGSGSRSVWGKTVGELGGKTDRLRKNEAGRDRKAETFSRAERA